MADEAKVFVNISVDGLTRQRLDRMVQDLAEAQGIDVNRSSFIRMLIRQEWERRTARVSVETPAALSDSELATAYGVQPVS